MSGPLLVKDFLCLGGGRVRGGLPYKSDRDACQKIQIKPLRETNVGVAQA